MFVCNRLNRIHLDILPLGSYLPNSLDVLASWFKTVTSLWQPHAQRGLPTAAWQGSSTFHDLVLAKMSTAQQQALLSHHCNSNPDVTDIYYASNNNVMVKHLGTVWSKLYIYSTFSKIGGMPLSCLVTVDHHTQQQIGCCNPPCQERAELCSKLPAPLNTSTLSQHRRFTGSLGGPLCLYHTCQTFINLRR